MDYGPRSLVHNEIGASGVAIRVELSPQARVRAFALVVDERMPSQDALDSTKLQGIHGVAMKGTGTLAHALRDTLWAPE